MASNSMNRTILIGRISDARNPNARDSDGPACVFTLVTEETQPDGAPPSQADHHLVVVKEPMARFVRGQLASGSLVYVEGKLRTRRLMREDGESFDYSARIEADIVKVTEQPAETPKPADDVARTDSESRGTMRTAVPGAGTAGAAENHQPVRQPNPAPARSPAPRHGERRSTVRQFGAGAATPPQAAAAPALAPAVPAPSAKPNLGQQAPSARATSGPVSQTKPATVEASKPWLQGRRAQRQN